MSFSRRQSHKERKEKLETDLVNENKKLNQDVQDLENALELHHHLQSPNTVTDLLRNEIGGSRWQYGGTGKLTTFKTGRDLNDPLELTPERPATKMSRPSSANVKKHKNKTIESLEKLKKEIDIQRSILEEKYHLSEKIQQDIRKDKKIRQRETKSKENTSASSRPNSNKILNAGERTENAKSLKSENENLEDSLFNTDYLEINNQKDKVLEKLSSKVIHRSGKIKVRSKSPAKKPDIGFGGRIEKKPEKSKPVKNSLLRNFRKAQPANVINDIEKNTNPDLSINDEEPSGSNEEDNFTKIVDTDLLSSQKYLSEPQDEVLGLSRALSRIKADHEKEEENRKYFECVGQPEQLSPVAMENVYDEKKLNDLLKSETFQLNLDFVKNSIDREFESRKCNQNTKNQNGYHETDSSTSDYSSDVEIFPVHSSRSDFQKVQGSNSKTAFSYIPKPVSSEEGAHVSKAFEVLVNNISQSDNSPPATNNNNVNTSPPIANNNNVNTSPLLAISDNVHTSSFPEDNNSYAFLSPPSSAKPKSVKADRFVKAWIRKLGIEEVQKTALIFAKNNVGMAVMKYVTEEQVCEMGFSSVSVMDKIIHGIQTLKLISSSKSLVRSNPEIAENDEEKDVPETTKYVPNNSKRQARREKYKLDKAASQDQKPKASESHGRPSLHNKQIVIDKNEVKKPFSRPRSGSRSREMAQKRKEAAVAATAQKKIEKIKEDKRKEKEREKLMEKQRQHRDMLAAKHQEREIHRTVSATQEPDIFTVESEDGNSEATGRSTALDDYLISSRVITPECSLTSLCAADGTIRPGSDISPEQVRSMIKTLLSSDHLQDHMTLNLVKNLQKQLEDVENQIRIKQENMGQKGIELQKTSARKSSTSTSKELIISQDNLEQTPIPQSPVDEVFRCDSNIGIWDPSQAPNILSEIVPSVVMAKKATGDNIRPTSTVVSDLSQPRKCDTDNSTSTCATDVSRPKTSTSRGGSVASMSMSKRALLDEIRKEKDEHRKQIRHLQSELTRLQHKDPVKKSEIPKENIIFKEKDLLGEGAFSRVFRGNYQAAEVAVKQLKVPLDAQDKNYFAAEVSLLRDLRHPRVVLLLGVCTDTKLPLMVLEYMSNGNLYSILHDPNRPPLDHVEFYQIARDIASGMVYLHNNQPPVLHLDLKSMNVLIGPGHRAKIADFGFSKLKHEADLKAVKSKQIQGSPSWMAPELLLNGDVTVKTDVYSFGVILWEMVTRKQPYEGCSIFQILEHVRLNKRPEIPDHCPVELKNLVEKCWHHNPTKRPVFKEILNIMENLSFPSEWRALFAEAGIPTIALNDIQSTRNIISLVNSTLESATLQQMVKESREAIPEDDLSSQTSVTDEDISIDSLDDELGIVTLEDSFENIVVKSQFSHQEGQRHSVNKNDFETKPSTLNKPRDKIGLQKHEKNSRIKEMLGSKSDSHFEPPKPSPRKSKTLGQRLKTKVQSDDNVRKSKEAWSLTEELKLPLFQDQEIPAAPPPPPVGHPSQATTSPLVLSANNIRPKQSVPKDLTKELARYKDKKLKPIAKSKPKPEKRFEVNVSALQEQRKSLKPVTLHPHTSQLKPLHDVPKEALASIADILKKAIHERRFAIGEVGVSNDGGDWSYQSELSL